MRKHPDLMIDVESLGNTGNFAVMSIAVVPFDIEEGEIGEGSVFKFPIKEQTQGGMHVNEETLLWWLNQDIEIFKKQLTQEVPQTVAQVFKEFSNYISKLKPRQVWASAGLDWNAINNLCEFTKMPNPISHRIQQSSRTTRYLSGRDFSGSISYSHDPLQDCIEEIQMLLEDVREIHNGPTNLRL